MLGVLGHPVLSARKWPELHFLVDVILIPATLIKQGILTLPIEIVSLSGSAQLRYSPGNWNTHYNMILGQCLSLVRLWPEAMLEVIMRTPRLQN